MTNIVSQIVAIVVLTGLVAFWLAGWVIYGQPLGAVPLAFCDVLGMEFFTVCG